MNNNTFYIDAIKEKQGISSDYAVSKMLGISRQAVSKLHAGEMTFDSDLALKVSELSGYNVAGILLAMKAMKAKDSATAKIWAALAKKQQGVAASFILITMLLAALLGISVESIPYISTLPSDLSILDIM